MRPSNFVLFHSSRVFPSPSLDYIFVLAARSRRFMCSVKPTHGLGRGAVLCVCEDGVEMNDRVTRLTVLARKIESLQWWWEIIIRRVPVTSPVRRRRTWSTKARPSVYDPPKPIPHVYVGKSTTTTNRYRPRLIARALRAQTAMIINNSTIITNNMRQCVAFESQVQQTPAPYVCK